MTKDTLDKKNYLVIEPKGVRLIFAERQRIEYELWVKLGVDVDWDDNTAVFIGSQYLANLANRIVSDLGYIVG